jgi:hypothetical protein
MVSIEDIPAFPGQPGQNPIPGAPPSVVPIAVVLVTAPLDREYRNIALNAAAVDAFIAAEVAGGRAHSENVERWSPWSDLPLQLDFAAAAGFNYGRFTIGERSWYAFLSATYLNLNDTLFAVDADNWTTYGPTIGYGMVERGHVAVAAAADAGDVYGNQYLTAPEPIDAPPVQGVLAADILGSGASGWTVLVISANDLRGTGGLRFFELHTEASEIMQAAGLASSATITHDGTVQFTIADADYPWTEGGVVGIDNPEVAVPFVTASPVSTIDGVAAGGGVYLFTPRGFARYMTIMQGAPWITSGIVDVRLVPDWAVGGGGDAAFSATVPTQDPGSGLWAEAGDIPNFTAAVTSATVSEDVLNGWRATVLAAVGATGWTKLVTSQFTDLLVGNGDVMRSFRPDQWQHPDVTFEAVTGAAHGDPSIRLIPTGYNDLGNQMGLDAPVGGAAGVTHSGFGTAASSPATNQIAPYLNAFSNHQSWLSNQQNRELAVTLGLTNIQLNAGVQAINTVLGAAGGATGGPAGALSGAIAAVPSLATAGITASNAITMLDISTDGSFDIGAYQLGLSGEASLAAFNTWYQSLSSQSGGGSPEHLASPWRAIVAQAFRVLISVPSAERIHALVSEWNRYGYMIGQAFIPPRLDPMTHRSYWQISEATILGALPQNARDAISRAFERGVTVWTAVAEIGTEPANAPRAGVSY